MTQLTPSIAEDIQMLVDFLLDEEKIPLKVNNAIYRIEAYLSTFKPDHL